MMKPQGFEAIRLNGRTCALGAALDAVGALSECYVNSADGENEVIARWPCAGGKAPLPEPLHGESHRMVDAVTFLNDYEKWTRERIADWVETLEQRSGDTRALVAVGLSDDATQLVNAR